MTVYVSPATSRDCGIAATVRPLLEKTKRSGMAVPAELRSLIVVLFAEVVRIGAVATISICVEAGTCSAPSAGVMVAVVSCALRLMLGDAVCPDTTLTVTSPESEVFGTNAENLTLPAGAMVSNSPAAFVSATNGNPSMVTTACIDDEGSPTLPATTLHGTLTR